MISAAALAQSLSLWAMPWTLIQNQTPNRFPDGTASLAKPAACCEPVRLSSRAPLPPTRRELALPIPRQSASLPANGSDAAGLGFGSRPVPLCPAVIQANPTMLATPTTARATASDCAIRSYRHGVQIGHRLRGPSRPESNAGRSLQQSPPPHTTATDAASPASGSSCGRNPGIHTASPQ
jgi:hypothetical protein